VSARVVFVTGSPSVASRSSIAADVLAQHVRAPGIETRTFSIRDFS
jgi:NAD(P)H-dependent FMN reductase